MIGRYQPLLLLYASSSNEPIDATCAPDRNVLVAEQLPAKQGLE